MKNVQQINLIIILLWLFQGMLGAHFAQKRGRNPLIWFFVALLLGCIGIISLFFFPKVGKSPPPPNTMPAPKKSELWLNLWYYLDPNHEQQGPFELPDLIKIWNNKDLSEHTFIWSEGMQEWTKVGDLPDLVHELNQV